MPDQGITYWPSSYSLLGKYIVLGLFAEILFVLLVTARSIEGGGIILWPVVSIIMSPAHDTRPF